MKQQDIKTFINMYPTEILPEEIRLRPINILVDNANSLIDKGIRFNKAISILKTCINMEDNNIPAISSLAIACSLRAFSLSFGIVQKYLSPDPSLQYKNRLAKWQSAQLDNSNILFGTLRPYEPSQITTLDDNKIFSLTINKSIYTIEQLTQIVSICLDYYYNNKVKFNANDISKIGWASLILWKLPRRVISSNSFQNFEPDLFLNIIEAGSQDTPRSFANACIITGKIEPLPPKYSTSYNEKYFQIGLKLLEKLQNTIYKNDYELEIHINTLKSWILEPVSLKIPNIKQYCSQNLLFDMIAFPTLSINDKFDIMTKAVHNEKIQYYHDDNFKPRYTLFMNHFLDQTWQSLEKITSDFDDEISECIEYSTKNSTNMQETSQKLLIIAKYIVKILENIDHTNIITRNNFLPLEMFSLNKVSKCLQEINQDNKDIIPISNSLSVLIDNFNRRNKISRVYAGR